MTKTTLIKKLKVIANSEGNTIEKYVAQEALDSFDPENFFQNILSYGCATGIVCGLIYYADTHKFFDTHYAEIEELRIEYEQSTSCPVKIQDRDLKNTLAWFAFEQTAYNLANKLELEV